MTVSPAQPEPPTELYIPSNDAGSLIDHIRPYSKVAQLALHVLSCLGIAIAFVARRAPLVSLSGVAITSASCIGLYLLARRHLA